MLPRPSPVRARSPPRSHVWVFQVRGGARFSRNFNQLTTVSLMLPLKSTDLGYHHYNLILGSANCGPGSKSSLFRILPLGLTSHSVYSGIWPFIEKSLPTPDFKISFKLLAPSVGRSGLTFIVIVFFRNSSSSALRSVQCARRTKFFSPLKTVRVRCPYYPRCSDEKMEL